MPYAGDPSPRLGIRRPLGNELHNRANFRGVIDDVDLAAARKADLDTLYLLARANLLVNGGFEVAQRGTGPFTTQGAYTLDRWRIERASSTVSITQITSTIGTKGRSAQIAYTHVGGGQVLLYQELSPTAGEHIQLLGKQLTVSFKVKSTVAGTIRAFIQDSVGGVMAGSYNVGTGEETITHTATVAATTTFLSVGVQMNVATATAEVNDAMLIIGSVAADYQPLAPPDDLARCQRYYEKVGEGIANGNPTRYSYGVGGVGYASQQFGFKVTKAVAPTVTKVGATWNVSNCSQPSILNADKGGFGLYSTVTSTGDYFYRPSGASDYVTAEANP